MGASGQTGRGKEARKNMQEATIAAIATAPGAGGIAVVRLSGAESYQVAARVFCPANAAKKVEQAKGYTAMYGAFREGNETFDEGVALFFIVPRNAAEWYCFFNQFPGNG